MLDINTGTIQKKLRQFMDIRILGLLVFGVMVVLISWSGLKVLQTNFELEKKIADLKQREIVQQLENDNLRLKNKYLETDQYLELSARRQFGKAAPGERVYLVPKKVALARTVDLPKTDPSSTDTQTTPKSRYRQNFDDWMNFLLHQGG